MHNPEKNALVFAPNPQASSSSNELHFPFDLQNNGILRLYNQFPRCYKGGIDEMTAQLPAIKRMGFNAVWINPLHLTGKKEVTRIYDKDEYKVKGSLYAMADDQQFNPAFNVDEQKVKAYTKAAIDLGLIPMFDLVLNQVAADEGTPIMKAFKDYLAYKTKEDGSILWDDTMFFQYHDKNPDNYPKKHPDNYRVIVDFWKEFITRYIDYGFLGVRVDALTELGIKDKKQHGKRRKKKPEEFFDESKRKLYWQLELQREIYEHVKACCEKTGYKPYKPVILGELFCKTPTIFVNSLKGIGLTHINNSVFYANFSKESRKNDKQDDKGPALRGWNAGDWVLHQLNSLKQIMHKPGIVSSSPVGGTIGYVGNHDVMSLAANVEEKNNQQIVNPVNISKIGENPHMLINNPENISKIKEKIASVAFTSDSGWYMLCGDEFGLKTCKPMVFDNFPKEDSPFKQKSCLENWGGKIDLSQFIANINYVLSQLPPANLYDWVDHIVFDGLPNSVIILRHGKKSNDDQLTLKELICVDLSANSLNPDSVNPFKLLKTAIPSFAEYENKISKVFWVASDKVIIYNSHNGEPEKTWNWDVKSEPEPISSNTKDTDLNTMEMSNAN